MDASNIAESMESISTMSSNMDEIKNECFNFPSLPYVCQKRFAETLDVKTLKTFATINFSAFNLSKRCHTIKRAEIIEEDCHFTLSCSCNEKEFCKGAQIYGFSASSKIIKMDVLETIIIRNEKEISDAHDFQCLPVNFNSIKSLILEMHTMKLDDLKTMIHTEMKLLNFKGGIQTTCSLAEFIQFIKMLSKLDVFHLRIIPSQTSVSFDVGELMNQLAILKSRGIINISVFRPLFIVIAKFIKM